MEFSCDRGNMLAAFQIAASVAPTRTPKPILQNVKIEVMESQATLMGTDLDVSVRVVVDGVDVQRPGMAVLPVDRFGSILRESSDERLKLESTESTVRVRGERSDFQLMARNPDEFPMVRDFEESAHHELPGRILRELIHRTAFATDVESTRYALGGVLMEFEENKLTCVGTDGRRLAKMEAPATAVAGHRGGDSATIVPTRSMQLVERAIGDREGLVQIGASGNEVIVRSGNLVIVSRLVEGRYPKWRDVFPKRVNAVRIELIVGPMLAAVRQAAIVTNNESRGLEFTFGSGQVVIAASTAELGQSRVEFPIPYDGPPVTVILDNKYVIDFLRVLDPQKTFTMELEGVEGAALFTTDDGFAYVVMPLSREH